jgi:hypothetical protein
MSAATSPSIMDVSALGLGWVLSFWSTCVAAGLSPAVEGRRQFGARDERIRAAVESRAQAVEIASRAARSR